MSLLTNHEAFKNEVKSNGQFIDASYCSWIPMDVIGPGGHKRKGNDSYEMFYSYAADEDYLNTLKLEMIEGRFFSKDIPSDVSAVVINETAARIFGITNLTQKEIINGGSDREVVGIVKDFNVESLKSDVNPLIIYNGGKNRMLVRLAPGDILASVSALEGIWKKYSSAPIEYTFLDERLQAQYESERRLANISIAFTGLSIMIAGLGLLGLVTYMASQRTKEIGIRKVMGASIQQIVVLLSKDFLRLVTIAFVIAIPVSWYAMDKWLQSFAYRVDFSLTVALSAGCVVVLVALLTISFQSIKAAMGNPVESLRSE